VEITMAITEEALVGYKKNGRHEHGCVNGCWWKSGVDSLDLFAKV
jgi:hypothetical protein